MPADVTKFDTTFNPNPTGPLDGLIALVDDMWPKAEAMEGPDEGILVEGDDASLFVKETGHSVKLDRGQILVAVRRPSHVALIKSPLANISLAADGDIMVTYDQGGLIRIMNISGRGTVCKIKLDPSIWAGEKQTLLSIKPGFELVGSISKVTRPDIRPADGVARRGSKLIANGHIAVSGVSIQSVLGSNAIIAKLNQKDDKQDRRIIANMSKMAAVLNYVNGEEGYKVEGSTGLATVPGAGTH
jgi:hypothetical protein